MPLSTEQAETLALRALGWLVTNEDLLPVFLGATGASEADLKTRATDSSFLGALLEFLMLDDAWIIGFCDHAGLEYDLPRQARDALTGGEVNWT